LSNNAIGYQGANYIADALASAETLEELNLSGALPHCRSKSCRTAAHQLTVLFRRECFGKRWRACKTIFISAAKFGTNLLFFAVNKAILKNCINAKNLKKVFLSFKTKRNLV
jgi:hypothetical protein